MSGCVSAGSVVCRLRVAPRNGEERGGLLWTPGLSILPGASSAPRRTLLRQPPTKRRNRRTRTIVEAHRRSRGESGSTRSRSMPAHPNDRNLKRKIVCVEFKTNGSAVQHRTLRVEARRCIHSEVHLRSVSPLLCLVQRTESAAEAQRERGRRCGRTLAPTFEIVARLARVSG